MNAAFRGARPIPDASNDDVARTLREDPDSVYRLAVGFHSSTGRLQSVMDNESHGYIAQCGRFFIYAVSDRNFVVHCIDRMQPFPFCLNGNNAELQAGVRILTRYAQNMMESIAPPSAPNPLIDMQAAITAGIQQQIASMGIFGDKKVELPPNPRTLEAEIRAKIESENRARLLLENELRTRQEHEARLREERDAQIKHEIETELRAQFQREAELKARHEAELKARELKAQQQREADLRAQQLREVEIRAQKQRDAEYLAKREAEIKAELESEYRLLSPTTATTTTTMARSSKSPPLPKAPPSSWPVIDLNSPVVIVVVVVVALLFLHNQSLGHEIQAQRFQGARERAHSEAFERNARNEIMSIQSDFNQKYTRLHDEASYMRGELAGRSKRVEEVEDHHHQHGRVDPVAAAADSSSSFFSMPSMFNMFITLFIIMGIYCYFTHYATKYGASYSTTTTIMGENDDDDEYY